MFVFNGAQQFGVGKHEYRVALIQYGTFFCYDSVHESALHSIDLECEDWLGDALHIHVFQEVTVLHLYYLIVLSIDAQLTRTDNQRDYIHHEGEERYACHNVVAVLDVPGLWFKLYIHDVLFYSIGNSSEIGNFLSKSYAVIERIV